MRSGILVSLLLLAQEIVDAQADSKADPGTYSQWRERIAYTDPDNLPSCLDKCVAAKCGPEFKGAATCGAMFEYKDEPDPDNPGITTYVHCFCQRSVTYTRSPSLYCGPGGQLCEHTPAAEGAPPTVGPWVDGLNTMIEENNIQGTAHLNNYKSKVNTACYELFIDDTKVTRTEAKSRCEAKEGFLGMPEILSPNDWLAFTAVANQTGSSIYMGLTIGINNPPNCVGDECLDDGWYWERSNIPLDKYQLNLYSGDKITVSGDWQVSNCLRWRRDWNYFTDYKCGYKFAAYVCQKPCE